MSAQQIESIPAICVRFTSDRPIDVTPYLVKGAIINDYPADGILPYINGDLRGQVSYPRVQVKVLRQQLCIFGVAEGYELVMSFRDVLKQLQIDDSRFLIEGHESLPSEFDFQVPKETYYRYKFITPWVALNRHILAQFTALVPSERVTFLNRLLVQNMLFLAREFGLVVPYNVSARVKLQSLSPRVVEEQGSGSFKGYFTTNVRLPEYLGLGNGITKGLGTIVGI